MSTLTYYPPLRSLIALEDLPPQLGFIKDGLAAIFSGLYYKNLQYSSNGSGSAAFYSLTLCTYKRIGFAIPGTEIGIYLNPAPPADPNATDDEVTLATEIPVTLRYDWGILNLIAGFSLESFADDALALLGLIVKTQKIDVRSIVRNAIGSFASTTGSINAFVADINSKLSTSLPPGVTITVPSIPDPDEQLDALIGQIEDVLNKPVIEMLYALYLLGNDGIDGIKRRIEQLFSSLLGGMSVMQFIESLLIPKVDASLEVTLAVEFPQSILMPLVNGEPTTDPLARSTLSFGKADFSFSSTKGIGFSTDLEATLTPSQIGNTGLTIAVTGAKLDLSTTTTLPEVAADGRGPDFVGAYIKYAEIGFPKFWSVPETGRPANPNDRCKIIGRNLLIGTGGLSGSFSLVGTAQEGVLKTRFGGDDNDPNSGFSIELDQFDIHFHQGSIVDTTILGKLKIQGYAGDIQIQVKIDDHGFEVAATAPGFTFSMPDIFSFTITSLRIGERNGRWFIGTSGSLSILASIPGSSDPFIREPIDIQKLVIWSNGEIEIEGGSIVLPKAVSFQVGPVDLSVTAIHLGSHEQTYGGQLRHYRFYGFDGGIDTGAGGVDARGEGIKYYFTVDDGAGKSPHRYLRIESIHVDITIPGDAPAEDAAVILKGYLSMKDGGGSNDPSSSREYAGSVSLSLPKLDIAGSAGMRLSPDTGAFLVDIDLELSTPILLGTTGLGIYGFRGLVGNNYVASKKAAGLTDDDTWFAYYRKPTLGVNINKFAQGDGFAFGAGISLATAADSGTAFSSKLFFLLSIPELFLLEGQASILSKRIGLDSTTDPPFYAAIFISKEGIQAGFGAHLDFPADGDMRGDLATVDARMEMAFFYGRSNAWYINLGKDTPESDRIQARILKLVDMYAYFMLSSSGIKAGAGANWRFEKKFGPAKVGLGASMDLGGQITFRPIQIGGFFKLAGYAEVSVFGLGFRLDVSAELRAEAPNPFVISGSFSLKIRTPWPLPDVNISCSLTWVIRDVQNLDEIGFISAKQYASLAEYLADPKLPARGTHMLTQEGFPLNFYNRPWAPNTSHNSSMSTMPAPGASGWIGQFSDFTLPVDTYLDIEFTKGIIPDQQNPNSTPPPLIAPITTSVAGTELVPPQKGYHSQVSHRYLVKDVQVRYWKPSTAGSLVSGTWENYQMKFFNSPLVDIVMEKAQATRARAIEIIGESARMGFWQMTDGSRYTKLRILGRTPLEHAADSSPIDLGFPRTSIFCPPDPIPKVCQNWRVEVIGTIYPGGERVTDRKLQFEISPQNGEVVEFPNIFRLERSVMILRGGRLEIFFPTATTSVSLKLITLTDKVTISYYNGYASGPSDSGSSGSGSSGSGSSGGGTSIPPTSWDAVPDTPAIAVGSISLWDKLYNTPRYKRLLCVESATPDIQSGAAGSIRNLLEEFALTNAYLRQILNLSDAMAVDDPITTLDEFCQRLTETLETLLVGLTGKDSIPPVFQPNVDHFFEEIAGYIDEYWSEGLHAQVPDATANAFYEKWMGLIACLGRLYDTYSTLPAAIQAKITQIIDPEIGRIYHRVNALNATTPFSLELNAATWLGGAADQLRSFAGFFGALSLDFSKIISSGADALLQSYFQRLSDAYFQVVRAMRAAGVKTCGSPNCDRTADLIAIARLICVGTPNMTLSTAMEGIGSLTVTNWDSNYAPLLRYFGWEPTQTADYCTRLRRVLGIAIVAYASYDELPFTLRYLLDTFYAKLQLLMVTFRQDTRDLTLPTPDATVDEFNATWTSIFSCLCRMCSAEGLSASDQVYLEQLLAANVDPEIDAIYASIISTLYNGLSLPAEVRWTMGAGGVPVDLPGRVTMLNDFFAAALSQCGGLPSQVLTLLDSWYPTTEYGIVTSTMSNGGYTLCGGVSDSLCNEVIWPFTTLRELRARNAELPSEVVRVLQNTIAPIVERIYRAVFNLPVPTPITPAADVELMLWEIDEVLRYFRERCYHSVTLGSSMISLIGADLSMVMGAISSMQTLQSYRDGADFVGLGSCDWQYLFTDMYRTFCIDPPVTLSTTAINLILGFNSTLAAITDTLGLAEVDLHEVQTSSCAAIGDIFRILMIASSRLNELSVPVLCATKKFVSALENQVPYSRTYSSPSCVATCSNWLSMLNCLCRIVANRGLFPSLDSDIDVAISDTLAAVCGRVLMIADYLGIEFQPNQSSSSRCRKVLTIRNYFAVMGLDFANVDPTLIDFFSNREAFETAFELSALQPFRDAICFPIPTPYDPLMKREVKLRGDLFRGLEYDDPTKPIDRIVIEVASCTDAVGGSWPADYWTQTLATVQNSIIPAITTEKSGAQAEYNQLTDHDSDDAHMLSDRIDALTAELGRANDFAAQIATPPALSFPQCVTFLIEVCYLPPAVYNYNLNLPPLSSVRRVAQDMQKALSMMTQPIWRPDTLYAVQLELREQVNDTEREYTRYVSFGFQTAGPLGHYHQMGNGPVRPDYSTLVAAERESEYKYASLRNYIDFKRSYPNADGNIIDAKPLYYGHTKLHLFFTKDYIASMYSNWGWGDTANPMPLKYIYSALEFVIKDPGNAPGDPEISVIANWSDDPSPHVQEPFKRFNNMARNTTIGGKNCVTIGEVEAPAKAGAVPLPPDVNLQPLKLYTAVCNALFAEYTSDPATDTSLHPTQDAVRHEVHRYVFQTSRYASFAEQIGSYHLSVAPAPVRNAISIITLDSSIDVTAARDLILGQNQSTTASLGLIARYPLAYDRLVEGILGLGGLPQAETTEIFVIKDHSANVLGLLVRSPEPFNDPKIPEDVLANTLQVQSLGSNTRQVFSKDRAKVFVTGAAAGLTGTSVDLVFALWEYDGSAYGQATVLTKDNQGVWQNQAVPSITITVPLT